MTLGAEKNSKPCVSVIIVTWNALERVRNCLSALFQNSEDVELEVWLVDNASEEPVTEMVRDNFASVNVIQNKENLGFGTACNQGIRASKHEVILLLNPDTEVQKGAIKKMAVYISSHREIGGISPQILDSSGLEHLWFLQPSVSLWWELLKETGMINQYVKILSFIEKKYHIRRNHVSFLTGCCLVTRKSLVEKIGMFDESFFLYSEDIDLSLRIKDAGKKIEFFRDAAVLHHEGQSTSIINYQATLYGKRAKHRLFIKRGRFVSASIYKVLVYTGLYIRISLTKLWLQINREKRKNKRLLERWKSLNFVLKELKRTWK